MRTAPPTGLSADESLVFEAVGHDETPIDLIIETTGMAAPAVVATLMRLEMRRIVRQLPGLRYVRR